MNLCGIHHMVEVSPGNWQYFQSFYTTRYPAEMVETICPVCVRESGEAVRQLHLFQGETNERASQNPGTRTTH